MSAFTLWTEKAMNQVELAFTGITYAYGIAYWGEIWFRFYHPPMKPGTGRLMLHSSGYDSYALMERRNS